MKFIILTLFPESFDYLKSYGVIGKAIQNNLIELEVVNIRDYTKNKHKKVDDEIYGGGAGMLMTCQPIYDCLEDVNKNKSKVVFMSPQGKVLNQQKCIELSKEKEIGGGSILTKDLRELEECGFIRKFSNFSKDCTITGMDAEKTGSLWNQTNQQSGRYH